LAHSAVRSAILTIGTGVAASLLAAGPAAAQQQEDIPTFQPITVFALDPYQNAIEQGLLVGDQPEDWVVQPWEPWWYDPVYYFGKSKQGYLGGASHKEAGVLPLPETYRRAPGTDGGGTEQPDSGAAQAASGQAAGTAKGTRVQWFGYTQATIEALGKDGVHRGNVVGAGDGPRFGADRARIGYRARFLDGVYSQLMVDFIFESNHDRVIPEIIQDAYVGYDFGGARVQVGQFKAPVGMDYATSAAKLDITKRGLDTGLVLNRVAGAMVSAEAGGFGIDVGVFNPAERSGSVTAERTGHGIPGDQYAWAGRLRYRLGSWLYAELSGGASQVNGDVITTARNRDYPGADYRVVDLGLRWQPTANTTFKAEYIEGSNVRNRAGDDEFVYYLHAGYRFSPHLEGVVRHYYAEFSPGAEPVGGGQRGQTEPTRLTNTIVGVNLFANPDKPYEARLQLNYVFAGADAGWDVYSPGVRPNFKGVEKSQWMTDDAWLLQAQAAF